MTRTPYSQSPKWHPKFNFKLHKPCLEVSIFPFYDFSSSVTLLVVGCWLRPLAAASTPALQKRQNGPERLLFPGPFLPFIS